VPKLKHRGGSDPIHRLEEESQHGERGDKLILKNVGKCLGMGLNDNQKKYAKKPNCGNSC